MRANRVASNRPIRRLSRLAGAATFWAFAALCVLVALPLGAAVAARDAGTEVQVAAPPSARDVVLQEESASAPDVIVDENAQTTDADPPTVAELDAQTTGADADDPALVDEAMGQGPDLGSETGASGGDALVDGWHRAELAQRSDPLAGPDLNNNGIPDAWENVDPYEFAMRGVAPTVDPTLDDPDLTLIEPSEDLRGRPDENPVRSLDEALAAREGRFADDARPAGTDETARLMAVTFVVTSTADSGPGTLRQAILDANGSGGADDIEFNIPGVGAQTINLTASLPNVTEAITMDGATQPWCCAPQITLDSGGGGFTVLTLSGHSGSTIQNLAFRNNPGGTQVLLSNADDATLENVDVSRVSGGRGGTGISLQTGTDGAVLRDITATGRSQAILANGGSDLSVLGADLSDSDYGFELNGVVSTTLSGGVRIDDVDFTDNTYGLYLQNMSDLIISDGTIVGTHITPTLGGGTETLRTVTNRPLWLRNIDDTRIERLDMSWSAAGRPGDAAIYHDSGECENLEIRDVNGSNRNRGFYLVANVRDLIVEDNFVTNTNQAMEIRSVFSTTLPGGISMSGNDFSQSTAGLRIDSANNLVISDGSEPGTNIDLTDQLGNHTLNTVATGGSIALYLVNCDDCSVTDLDLSWTGSTSQDGYALQVQTNSDRMRVEDNTIDSRRRGIYLSGGEDLIVRRNTLTRSGFNTNEWALQILSAISNTLVGGVIVEDNDFTGAPYGVRFDGMSFLTISDGTQPGTNVDLHNLAGAGTLTETSGYALYLSNIDDSSVTDLDLSWQDGSTCCTGRGLNVDSSSQRNVIEDNVIKARQMSIFYSGGDDVTIRDNDLGNSGQDTNQWALYMASIDLPIDIADNDFTDGRYGVRINAMSGLTISDGSAIGTNVKLTDSGGNHTLNTVSEYALYLNNVDDSLITDLDLSWTGGGGRSGRGLHVDGGSTGNVVQDLTITDRFMGIFYNGGSDVTIRRLDLSRSGQDVNQMAMYLIGIDAPRSVDEIDFTDAIYGVRLQSMSNITVSDGSKIGTDITLTLSSGVVTQTLTTVSGDAIYIYDLDDAIICNLDLSWLGDSTRRGRGIYNERRSNRLTIEDNVITNRDYGIGFQSIGFNLTNGNTDITIRDNNLSDDNNSVWLYDILTDTVSGAQLLIEDNDHSYSTNGIRVERATGFLTVSDGSLPGTDIDVTDGSGAETLRQVTGNALYLSSIDDVVAGNMDLSWTGDGVRRGTALHGRGDRWTVSDVSASNRDQGFDFSGDEWTIEDNVVSDNNGGIYFDSGSDVTIRRNDLRLSGGSSALHFRQLVTGTLVEGNDYSDSTSGIRIQRNDTTDLTISDGSVTGSNLIDVTNEAGEHTLRRVSGTALELNVNDAVNWSIDNVTVTRLNLGWEYRDVTGSRSGTGLQVRHRFAQTGFAAANLLRQNNNVNISYLDIEGRSDGILLNQGNPLLAISCTRLVDNNDGIEAQAFWNISGEEPVTIVDNLIEDNTNGIRWNTNSWTLPAEGNWWGAADGPSNLGGAGNGYINDVDADPFLTSPPACAPVPFEVTTTADTVDGDVSSVTSLTLDRGTDDRISLREAILATNNTPGADEITFNISPTGAATIILVGALPTISESLTIDGSTQPGFAGLPVITLDAGGVAGPVLTSTGDGTVLTDLAIVDSPDEAIVLSGLTGALLRNLDLPGPGGPAAGKSVAVAGSTDVTMEDIKVSDRVDGVHVSSSSAVTITCSSIVLNTTGVLLDGTSSGVRLTNNEVDGNTAAGLDNSTPSPVDALFNWWGDPSGPACPTACAPPNAGIGDAIIGTPGSVAATPFLGMLPPCIAPSVFEVTTIYDVDDGDTSSIAALVASPGADSAISLREAILATNATVGVDAIPFNIGAGGQKTLLLTSTLPVVTEGVLLDGATQPGTAGLMPITLDASGFSGGDVLSLSGADDSVLASLAVTGADSRALHVVSSDRVTMTLLDLSWGGPPAGRRGTGVRLASSDDAVVDTITATMRDRGLDGNLVDRLEIVDSAFVDANTGILIDGGTDLTVRDNTLADGSTALDLRGVFPGTLAFPGGVMIDGNDYSNASSNGIELRTMSDLVISEGAALGTNVNVLDMNGMRTLTSVSGNALYLRDVTDTGVFTTDLGWDGPFPNRDGRGVFGDLSYNERVTLDGITATRRVEAIWIDQGRDITVTNSALQDNGTSIRMSSVISSGASCALPGCVNISKVDYSDSDTGLYLLTMADLVISPGTEAGTNIDVRNVDGTETLTLTKEYAIRLNNVDDSLVTDVDLSWRGVSFDRRSGSGLYVQSGSDRLDVEDVVIQERERGIYINSGTDLEIHGADLFGSGDQTNSGWNAESALHLESIDPGTDALPGGVDIDGLLFGDAEAGISMRFMNALTVTDGSEPTTNLEVLDGSGMESVVYPIFIREVDDSLFADLDLDWTASGVRTGRGFGIGHSADRVIFRDGTITNRTIGIYDNGNNNQDFTATDNDLSNNDTALQIHGLQPGSGGLTGGLLVEGNDYSNSDTAIYMLNVTGPVTMSTGAVAGTNFTVTNGGGMETTTSARVYAVRWNNVDDGHIEGLNLDWEGSSTSSADKSGDGFRCDTGCDNLSTKDLSARNRSIGVYVSSSSNVEHDGLDLRHSGQSSNGALYWNSNSGTRLITDVHFADCPYGAWFENMTGIIASDGSYTGTNVFIADDSGLSSITNIPIRLRNVDDSVFVDLTLSYTGTSPSGGGIRHDSNTSTNLIIRDNEIHNRNTPLYLSSVPGVQVLNNSLRDASGVQIEIRTSDDAVVSGNDHTGSTGNGMGFYDLDRLMLDGATGLDRITGDVLYLDDVQDTTIDGLDARYSGAGRTGRGVYFEGGSFRNRNITITNSIFIKRNQGIFWRRGYRSSDGPANLTISCNRVHDNNVGIDIGLAGQTDTSYNPSGVVVFDNVIGRDISGTVAFQANNTWGIRRNTANVNVPPVTTFPGELVLAENNYWGEPDGPSNLGGSGDDYDGNVDADPFLTIRPACVNEGPVARDNAYSARSSRSDLQGQLITENTGQGVDSDRDAEDLVITEVNGSPANVGTPFSLGSGATLDVASNGVFTYNATTSPSLLALPSNAYFTETITYTLVDPNLFSSTAVVTYSIQGSEKDYGDLPDSPYPTLSTTMGAVHLLDEATFLGLSADDDLDGQPDDNAGLNPNAAGGDDQDGNDDEDGIAMLSTIQAGNTVTVEVTTSVTGYLSAWFDYDADGSLEPAERSISDTMLVSGTNTVNFTAPGSVAPELFARFRYARNSGVITQPTGLVIGGEVEDYVLQSVGNLVYRDNGDGGGIATNGTREGAEPGVPGATVALYAGGDTPEVDTPIATTTTDATGAYTFTGVYSGSYVVQLAAANFGSGGALEGLGSSTGAGDPNADLDEDDDENGLDVGSPISDGIRSGIVNVVPGNLPTSEDGNDNTNLTVDFGLVEFDFGDLPSPLYATLASENGARHVLDGVTFLGAAVDRDSDGQPSAGADGDDTDAGGDDEDGVTFLEPMLPGSSADIDVEASVGGFLTAWADWNGDGSFAGTGEQIFNDESLSAGSNSLSIAVPVGSISSTLFMRFRYVASSGVVTAPFGVVSGGEVEDYALGAIGDRVWIDDGTGGGTAGDGMLNGGESGVFGLAVELYDAADTPEVDAPLISTSTDLAGNYRFSGLPNGTYVVHVPASEFGSGALLEAYASSVGWGDPNLDIDEDMDENGVDIGDPITDGVSSDIIGLVLGAMPTSEDGDPNSNLTVDFAFVPQVDMRLTIDCEGEDGNPDQVRAGDRWLCEVTAENLTIHPAPSPVLTLTIGTGILYLSDTDTCVFSAGTGPGGKDQLICDPFASPPLATALAGMDPEIATLIARRAGLDEAMSAAGLDDVDELQQVVSNFFIAFAIPFEFDGDFATLEGLLTSLGLEIFPASNSAQDVDVVLPPDPTAVIVSRFDVAVDGQDVRLAWETASEANVAGFQLYRTAASGDDWVSVGEVVAAEGGASDGSSYVIKDHPGEGAWRYRLEVVLLDGGTRDGGITSISVEAEPEPALPWRAWLPSLMR